MVFSGVNSCPRWQCVFAGVVIPAVANLVEVVGAGCVVSEVFKPVISGVTVVVATDETVGKRTDKSVQDDAVELATYLLATATQAQHSVTGFVGGGPHDPSVAE